MSKCTVAREKLARYVDSLDQTSVEKVAFVSKMGLLANPKTAGRIAIGNLSSTAGWLARENVAAGIDYLLSFGKPAGRSVGAVADVQAAREFSRGFKLGVEKIKRHMRTGLDPDQSALEVDAPRIQFSHPFAQKLADGVSSIISAGDKPFFEAVQRVSILSRARALAMREGLTGADAQARVDFLLRNPTDEMLFTAAADAAQVVGREQTGLSKAITSAKGSMRRAARKTVDETLSGTEQAAAHAKKIGGAAGYAASEVVAPFTTTPLSMAYSSVRVSPVGAAYELAKQLHPKTRSRLNATRALAGGGIMGVGGAALGWALASDGKMTGSEVTDEERALGMRPYSVRMGGRWVPIAWAGPAAIMPVMGAIAFHHGKAHPEGGTTGAAGAAAASFPHVLSEQTFAKSIKDAMGAIDDPTAKASSVIPNIVRVPAAVGQISRGLDPVVRETEKGPVSGGLQRVQASTPASRALPARLGKFGEELTRHGGGLAGFLQSVLDPTSSTAASDDPMYTELVRLKVPAAGLGRNIHILGKPTQRTPDDMRALLREHGPELKRRLEQRMRTPLYERLPDEQKAQALKTTMRDWSEMVSEQDRRRRVGQRR